MASSAGTLTVAVDTEITGALGIIVAAVKLHEALYNDPAIISISPASMAAYDELHQAINKVQQ